MDAQDLLKNKNVLIGIIVAVILVFAIVIVLLIFIVTTNGNSTQGGQKVVKESVIKEPIDLLTTDNLGKALEIQALLAREGLAAQRKADGSKSTIFLKEYTLAQRDRALLAIVKSGLMDQNVGLEVFDKGDFTSTKEDKRIRLARAINGELARLIRKIPPIENASVFVSIPEQSMFTSMTKPITATVQVTIPSGEILEKSKVKAITNLILGSVTGITYDNISITDTNGNVYSTIESGDDNTMSKLEENDKYMQQKIQAQLDRLLGKGNYVVTVSTSIRQTPIERSSIIYDPNSKTSVNEQTFSEGLGDESRDSSSGLNAVSVYVPNGVKAVGGNSASQNKSYSRFARETQYGVSKTQVNEYMKPGEVEEVSIALTIQQGAVPPSTSLEEIKQLVADAASPKVRPSDVSIAFAEMTEPYLAPDNPTQLPTPEESGNPWWLALASLGVFLIFSLIYIAKTISSASNKNKNELEMLKAKTIEQEKQLKDVNSKAAELIEQQEKLAQMAAQAAIAQKNLEQQQANNRVAAASAAKSSGISMSNPQIQMAINDISEDLQLTEEDEIVKSLKSWIEK